jgi:hypothetical protein
MEKHQNSLFPEEENKRTPIIHPLVDRLIRQVQPRLLEDSPSNRRLHAALREFLSSRRKTLPPLLRRSIDEDLQITLEGLKEAMGSGNSLDAVQRSLEEHKKRFGEWLEEG